MNSRSALLSPDWLQLVTEKLDRQFVSLTEAKKLFSDHGIIIKGRTSGEFIRRLAEAVRQSEAERTGKKQDFNLV